MLDLVQIKRDLKRSMKTFVYELVHELPKNFRLPDLGN